MAARNKPYEQFGPYILFKKLEADALSELWRAGRISGSQIDSTVALRRFVGGNREAMTASVIQAHDIVPQLSGTSFAKNQIVDVINGTPFIAHDYAGGRSLHHVVERARGGTGVTANPVPIDQAIVIAEKIALSVATTNEMRHDGHRLSHGALIPQFVWITEDGEIRVAGQQMAGGIVASLRDAKIAHLIGCFVAPEAQATGNASKTSDVFSLGALLYLLITGIEPPEAATASAFAQTVRAARTAIGNPLPDEIHTILEKSFTVDPAARYTTIAEMKQALSALAHGGKYSATTFNLAFYVSNLLKKEYEGEALDREKESKFNIVPYLDAAQDGTSEPPTHSDDRPVRSRTPMLIAAASLLVAAIAIGAYVMMTSHQKAAQTKASPSVTTAQIVPARRAIVSQPLVATPAPSATTTATTSAGDEAARKKAFEDAVQQKLQGELMKLQSDYTKSLQQKQSKQAPIQVAEATPAAHAPATPPRDENPSAAQLDQQRLATRQEASTTPAPLTTPARVAAVPQPVPAETQIAAPVVSIHEGDIVDVNSLDNVPQVIRRVTPVYPAMAIRERVETTVILTALVSETGDVIDVKVLRGDKRFGFEDAAIRAVRSAKFSAPVKDGKHVKTWFPVPVSFKM